MSLARLVRRVIYWLRFRSRQDELREELALHRELLADDLQRRGLALDAAHAAARRAMGNETLMREEAKPAYYDLQAAFRATQQYPAPTP